MISRKQILELVSPKMIPDTFLEEIIATGLLPDKDRAWFVETVQLLQENGVHNLSIFLHDCSKSLILDYIHKHNKIEKSGITRSNISDDDFFDQVVKFLDLDKDEDEENDCYEDAKIDDELELEKDKQEKREKILEILKIDKKSMLGYQKEEIRRCVFDALAGFAWALFSFMLGYVPRKGVLFSSVSLASAPVLLWMSQNMPKVVCDKDGEMRIEEISPIKRIESIEKDFKLRYSLSR